jgi:hypothetical protein
MDFSKLSSNDKLAVIGAGLAIVGAVLAFGGGGSFGLLTGILMLVIVFLPQFSPNTTLPGSKGSLMLIVGGVSAIGALFALLGILSFMGAIGGLYGGTWLIGLLLSTAGGLLMGWASWKEFQAEGGKFNVGMANTSPPPPAPPAAPPAPPAAPMSSTMQQPMGGEMGGESSSQQPMGGESSSQQPMGGESRPDDEPPA